MKAGFNTLMSNEVVTVFFDYVCPYAWRGAELVELVREPLGLTFEWQHFSLYQSNYEAQHSSYGANGAWQLWNERLTEGDEGGNRGLLPFLASCAARRQGRELHDRFRLELMRARHRDHRPFSRETLQSVAAAVGLDLCRFRSDMANPECRTMLAQEHHRAASLDIFGTPTFRFAGGHTAYLRLKALPDSAEEALELFCSYRRLLERFPYLETIKRPRPKGN
jgi:predicted DsbA family dithiol-disulfide isomerase